MLANSQYLEILIFSLPFVPEPFLKFQAHLKSVISFVEARLSYAARALCCIILSKPSAKAFKTFFRPSIDVRLGHEGS